MKSKDRIILEAFKLFCTKTYDQVTFSDLEKTTKLSRGAILYHFPSKENIFYEVINRYVLAEHAIKTIESSNKKNLFKFINSFIDKVAHEKKIMSDIGLNNMNLALLNIETNAYSFYPDMQKIAQDWYNEEFKIWEEVINNAISTKEIKNIDKPTIARLFEKIYFGSSFLSIPLKNGIEPDELKKDLLFVYELLK